MILNVDSVVSYFDILVSLTTEMAPYLLLGFILAGLTHAIFPREWIKTHLGGNGFIQSIKASLFGVPLPVCSCGIIPLAKELKKTGASNAGVAAFLASTPQTGVDSLAATAGLMGWPFAMMRMIVAFISGIFTGTLIGATEKSNPLSQPPTETTVKKTFSLLKITRYSLIELPNEIRNSLTLGLLIAALISLILPEYSEMAGGNQLCISYLGAVLLAIPLYVCSTGSIPIAIALITSGFSPGAALIFLIAGPATNIVTIVTMVEIIGLKNTILYLISVVGVAILAATLVDASVFNLNFSETVRHAHESGITLFQWLCFAILLFGIFYQTVAGSLSSLTRKIANSNSNIEWLRATITVEGMGCKKCASKVKGLIESLPNHKNAEINLETKTVTFEAEKIDLKIISEKLSKEGYTIITE